METVNMVIYKTTNLINGKIYIGQDSNNNPNYLGSGDLIKLAIKKYGKENFNKTILIECESQEELDKNEKFFIEKLKSRKKEIGYNISVGGRNGVTLNRKHSKETRKKMSEARKGITFSKETRKKMSEARKGITFSKETLKKMSEAKKGKKGKKLSKETREKMSRLRKGKKHSKETRKKMSEARKGDNNHFFGLSHTIKVRNTISEKNSKKVFEFKDGNKINEWDSLSKCALDNNINISYLSKCITNNKKCKKRYFKYEKVGTN